ncbi:hypothetical protein [Lapillicoccus sp.]|uniref:hypothetical protein n=1 Tax=Lapillicoccus sp. TaxID=1909287 RepID=UPI0032653401
MFVNEGSALTYAVVTDELISAADSVRAITESAQDATIEDLPSIASVVGHDGLFVALHDFCARWDNGLSHLVGDSETMARRLEVCAEAYLENEDTSRGDYQRLLSVSELPAISPVRDDFVGPAAIG